MTVRIRIKRHCPPVMQSNGESIDPGVGDVITVKDHVAAQLIRRGLAEPEDDTVPPLSDCDGEQCTIGWTPPPNTAVLVAVMKKDEGVR